MRSREHPVAGRRSDQPESVREPQPRVRAVLALQRSAGNAAVARLLSPSPERVVARFEAGEHAQMGEERTITLTARDGETVELTEGELIALGDFYATPDDMMNAPLYELLELRRLIRQDRMAFEGVPGAEPVTTDEWQAAMPHREEGKTYLDLLADNEGHFGPPSGDGAGGGEDHRSLFFSNHFRALLSAHAAAATTQTVPEEATALNGFACHFLTDAFSAGHLFNKAEMLTRIEEAWNSIDAWGPDLRNAFTDGVAALVMANPDAAGKLAGYRMDLQTIWGEQDITAFNFSKLLMVIAFGKSQDFYNVLLNLVHDRLDHAIEDPEHGIEVSNARGDTWLLAGDDTLAQSPDTLRLSQEAVAQSFRNLEQAAKTQDLTADAQMAQLVWNYTPRPTTAGAVVMNNLIVEMLDLTGAPTIQAFAAKTIENLDVAIAELVKEKYLIPKTSPDAPEPPTSHVPEPSAG